VAPLLSVKGQKLGPNGGNQVAAVRYRRKSSVWKPWGSRSEVEGILSQAVAAVNPYKIAGQDSGLCYDSVVSLISLARTECQS